MLSSADSGVVPRLPWRHPSYASTTVADPASGLLKPAQQCVDGKPGSVAGQGKPTHLLPRVSRPCRGKKVTNLQELATYGDGRLAFPA
jgi:hypothetical protein